MSLVEVIGKAVLKEAHFEWIIPDFTSLSDKMDDCYNSPLFSFDGEKWYLTLYPNGESGCSPEYMGFYLMRQNTGGSLKTVFYTFGIKGLDGFEKTVEIEHSFDEKGCGYGFPDFWSRSDLKERKFSFMPSFELTLTCDLRLNPHLDVVTGEKKLGNSLLSMLESGEDTDVVIKVQGKEFPAHRFILRARSPVFKSMFSYDMVEKQSGVVTIQDCDADTFQDFLAHIYSGSFESITTENAVALYTAADKYDISELKEECVKFMLKNIDITFFCDVMKLAVKYDVEKLIERATIFFCDSSLKIVKTAEWQAFLEKNAVVGNELFIKSMSKFFPE